MMKIDLKGFIKDVIPVLFGVLIALFINDWNQQIKDRKYIENFYVSLKQELEETDREINEKIPLQEALVDSLIFYSNNEDLALIDVILKGGGINGARIQLNYWKALSNSKIELISYDKLSILADIEDGKELLTYKRNKILDFVYSNLRETSSKEKQILKLMVEEALRSHISIQQDIQKILNQ